jgi:hypothetical protein
MIITIDRQGEAKFVYADKLAQQVRRAGLNPQIDRLSEVEPNEKGLWTVHFRHKPNPEPKEFESREAALAYEVELADQYLKEGEI